MNTVATQINRVSKHEFCRNTAKWLKELPLVITNNGKDEIKLDWSSSYTTPSVATEETAIMPQIKEVFEYRCGCKKTDKLLCTKHGRY